MPSIDDLLDTEGTKWRADIDAHFETTALTVEPPAAHPLRRRIAWAGSGLAAAAAATAVLVATIGGPAEHGGPPLAGPSLERSGQTPPSSHTLPGGGGPNGSASCAAPVLSFRNPLRGRHFSPVPRLKHPVTPGDSVRVFGDFFVRTCDDTGQGTPVRPIRSVPLILRTADGARRVVLHAHPHGSLGKFLVSVRIPANAAPGPAAISFGHRYGKVVLTVAGR